MKITAERKHHISTGHRVVGQLDPSTSKNSNPDKPGPCTHVHGHNYVITFYVRSTKLDKVGMVIDYGLIKLTLCAWLDQNWDHRLLLWEKDPWLATIKSVDNFVTTLPVNPTAENLAAYLLKVVGPKELKGTGATLVKVKVQETYKCSATVEL